MASVGLYGFGVLKVHVQEGFLQASWPQIHPYGADLRRSQSPDHTGDVSCL